MVKNPHDSGSASDRRPARVADVLRSMLTDPGRPRLTWYAAGGERIELSGAVVDNWVNKTSNLLTEEFDAGPGTRILLDAPAHWRCLIWAMATWRVGATLQIRPEPLNPTDTTPSSHNGKIPPNPDVIVTTSPSEWADTADGLVALTLPALARTFDGPLPAGALDAASAVMTYGDQLGPVTATQDERPALVAESTTTFADLIPRAAAALDARAAAAGTHLTGDGTGPGVTAAPRALIRGTGLGQSLLLALGVWVRDGSVVLAPGIAPERLAGLRAGERVTVDLAPAPGTT